MSQRVMDDGVTLGFTKPNDALDTHFTLHTLLLGNSLDGFYGDTSFVFVPGYATSSSYPLPSRERDKKAI
ncbi:MAG: hypothetical protein Q9M92_05210 [Enterobacterales bacterium]|nr:hypothetical protein [Enterobacterales bacterium]